MRWLRDLLHALLDGVLRFPRCTLCAAVAFTVVMALAASRLGIQANYANLLPESQPAVKEMRRLETIVGGASFVVLTVTTDQADVVPPFFAALAARLAGHPAIRYADYRPPLEFFRRNALLYLPVPELQSLVERVRRRIDQAKLKPLAIDLTEADDATFHLADLEAKYPQFLQAHDLYQSSDGRLFVMLIKPNGRATDTQFTRGLLADIQAAIAATQAELRPRFPEADALAVRMTGPYVKAMTQNAIVVRDAKRVSVVSMGGMLGFLFWYFRRKRAVALIGVPLFMSMTWAMGTAYVCFGTLNFFTAMASAVLLGLSADYGIHLYSRYLDHRREGLSPAEALRATYAHLGLAMWAAALTTIVGFLALALSKFTAFYQFGIIIALGMVHCLLAMWTVFPALTLLWARWRPERETATPHIAAMQRMAGRLGAWVSRARPFAIATGLAACTLIPIAAGTIRFNYHFSSILGVQRTKALDARVDKIFTHSINPEIARAETPEDAAAYAAAVRAAKTRNAGGPQGTTIATALALADFVPTEQETKLALVGALRADFTDTVLEGLSPDERQAYDRLAPALTPTPITMSDLPETVAMKFQDLRGERGKFLFIFPNFDPMNGREFVQFVGELGGVTCPQCTAPVTHSGESVIFHEIVRRMIHDGRWVMGAALAGIWVALLLAFRNVRHAIRCFVPFMVGLIGMFGTMGACGIPFTLVSLAAVPILLGIAIDYPIYLYQQSLKRPLAAAYATVAPPIFGSAATTIIGFGTLCLAENAGARSFGLAAVIGLTSCLLTTLLWFPGWLARLARREQATPVVTLSRAVSPE